MLPYYRYCTSIVFLCDFVLNFVGLFVLKDLRQRTSKGVDMLTPKSLVFDIVEEGSTTSTIYIAENIEASHGKVWTILREYQVQRILKA